MKKHPSLGFTLIEVLIALLIVSIALIASSKTLLNSVDLTHDIKQRVIADWIAENKLESHQANRDWMDAGTINGQETLAGITMRWREEVILTPNPSFKKIVINVYSPDHPDYSLRRLVGFLVKPMSQNQTP